MGAFPGKRHPARAARKIMRSKTLGRSAFTSMLWGSIFLALLLPWQVAAPGCQPVCRLPLQILKRAKEIVSIPDISAKCLELSNVGWRAVANARDGMLERRGGDEPGSRPL
jgi:hypothetical protein